MPETCRNPMETEGTLTETEVQNYPARESHALGKNVIKEMACVLGMVETGVHYHQTSTKGKLGAGGGESHNYVAPHSPRFSGGGKQKGLSWASNSLRWRSEHHEPCTTAQLFAYQTLSPCSFAYHSRVAIYYAHFTSNHGSPSCLVTQRNVLVGVESNQNPEVSTSTWHSTDSELYFVKQTNWTFLWAVHLSETKPIEKAGTRIKNTKALWGSRYLRGCSSPKKHHRGLVAGLVSPRIQYK